MESNHLYREARRRVERRVGFGIHLAVYVTINSGLIVLNLMTAPGRPWALGPLLGWGIGLLFHGLATALHAPGARWKQRLIEQEIQKQQQ